MSVRKGSFITFEGIDGCGKTTQAELLANNLKRSGKRVVFTREPGGTEISERIRLILLDMRSSAMFELAELFLYMASRAQLVREVVLPALYDDCIVICDRFTDSTLAYQGYGRGLDIDIITYLGNIATGGLIPDITILLDIDLSEANRRKRDLLQPLDRLEYSDISFHQKVRAGYLEIARRNPERFLVLDGSESVAVIEQKVWTFMVSKLRI